MRKHVSNQQQVFEMNPHAAGREAVSRKYWQTLDQLKPRALKSISRHRG